MKKTVLLVSMLYLLVGCSGSDLNDPDVKAVRESYRGMQRTATVGNSFDAYYDSSKWSKEISPAGEVLVIYEGKISSKSDKRQEIIKTMDELVRKHDHSQTASLGLVGNMTLYGYFYLLVGDPSTPQIQKIRELDMEVNETRYNAGTSLRTEEDAAIRKLSKETEAQIDALAYLKEEVKRIEGQTSSIKHEIGNINYPKRLKTFSPLEYQGEPKKLDPEEMEKVNQLNAQIAQLEEKINQIYSKYEDEKAKIIKEYSIQYDKIKKEFDPKENPLIKVEYEALRVDRLSKIKELSMQIIEEYVPKKGESIKVVWLKSADIFNTKKISYNIKSITGKGQQHLGLIVLP